MLHRLAEPTRAGEGYAERVVGMCSCRGCLAGALKIVLDSILARRFGERALGPCDRAGVVAGPKRKPTHLLEQLRAFDRATVIPEPLET